MPKGPMVSILNVTHQGEEPLWCGFRLECNSWVCTLAPPGEYD